MKIFNICGILKFKYITNKYDITITIQIYKKTNKNELIKDELINILQNILYINIRNIKMCSIVLLIFF